MTPCRSPFVIVDVLYRRLCESHSQVAPQMTTRSQEQQLELGSVAVEPFSSGQKLLLRELSEARKDSALQNESGCSMISLEFTTRPQK